MKADTPTPLREAPEALAPFDFQARTRVLFGAGVIGRLGEVARELGSRRALVVTDPGLEAAGHPARAVAALESAGVAVQVFDGVQENPTTRHVDAGVGAAREHGADLIVAVGGGSAMDCAKGVNFVFTNGGAMADYRGFGKAAKPMLPSIGVPTTAGTGSEAQSYALIADDGTHMKMACGDPKAAFRVALLDPEVTLSQPARVTALTGLDAIAHALESYVCTRRSALSQAFSRAAWRLLEPSLPRVLAEPADLAARGAMQSGAHLAGLAIESSMLGAAHACANPLTAQFGVTHGLAVGVMLPHVIRFNSAAAGRLYGDLLRDAGADGRADPAGELAERVTSLLHRAGLPTRLADCGVRAEAVRDVARDAAGQWTGRFNPRPLTEADFQRLYEEAL